MTRRWAGVYLRPAAYVRGNTVYMLNILRRYAYAKMCMAIIIIIIALRVSQLPTLVRPCASTAVFTYHVCLVK